VDLERLDRPVSPRVWRWAFSPAELEFLREPPEGPAQAESEKIPPGLALWCAKEAAAKAWGKALLNHLEQVRVTGTDWPEGRITVGYYEDCSRIRQSEVRLTAHNGYLAALARVIE
jgi:phosphopantetheinyl transferase